jgi:hypothetical protein
VNSWTNTIANAIKVVMQSGTILTLMIVQAQTQMVKKEINRIANASQLVVIFVHIKKVTKQKNCMLLNAEVIQIISTRKNAGVIATKLVVLIGQISQYPSLKATAEREVSAPVETANWKKKNTTTNVQVVLFTMDTVIAILFQLGVWIHLFAIVSNILMIQQNQIALVNAKQKMQEIANHLHSLILVMIRQNVATVLKLLQIARQKVVNSWILKRVLVLILSLHLRANFIVNHH